MYKDAVTYDMNMSTYVYNTVYICMGFPFGLLHVVVVLLAALGRGGLQRLLLGDAVVL